MQYASDGLLISHNARFQKAFLYLGPDLKMAQILMLTAVTTAFAKNVLEISL